MKLRTLVIDDEPIALEKLRSYVAKVPFFELVGVCRNGIEASAFINSEKIDVVFTDINMPDMSGLELMASLTNRPMVVFITAYAEYAVESYKFSAVDYLLKPYSFADFQRAANRVLEQSGRRALSPNEIPSPAETISPDKGNTLFVKVDYRYVRVAVEDILYIKGCGEYLQIFLSGVLTPLMTLSSFNSIKEKLSPDFIQVHRSYVVNMNCVQTVSKGRIVLDADICIPIGESYKNTLMAYLSAHSVGSIQKK